MTNPTATAARAAWTLAAACVLAGCGLPASPRHARLYTFTELTALADSPPPSGTFAEDAGVPGGLRIADYVSVDATDPAQHDLTLRSTWTETYRSAYATGELWTGFDEVWVQPVYVAITGFDKTTGQPLKAPDMDTKTWSPIFTVGAGSAFYSPFWRTFYFEVADAAEAATFTTARKVIDSGKPLIPGPAHTMSLVPDDAKVALTPSPFASQQVGGPARASKGYLDGAEIGFLDFGVGNFTWDDDLVVEPTPLFVFVYRDENGELQRMNVPTTAGTGPLYANHEANVQSFAAPHYGAFWRLYTVEVPPSARIFAPPKQFEAQSGDYEPKSFLEPDTSYGDAIFAAAPDDNSKYLGRIALDALVSALDPTKPGCFLAGDLESCHWLDSQAAIEKALAPTAIRKTDVLVTCPFVSYHDTPVSVTP